MWITRHFAARTLIGLAAFAAVLPALPSAECGCIGGGCSCQAAERPACCGEAVCRCGPDCACRGKQAPTDPTVPPALPPVDQNPAAKAAGESVATVSVTGDYRRLPGWRSFDASRVEAAPLAALDRCAALCRFTL